MFIEIKRNGKRLLLNIEQVFAILPNEAAVAESSIAISIGGHPMELPLSIDEVQLELERAEDDDDNPLGTS